jgi:glycosyltransferase involved in cell wall biosynthesis
MGKLKKSIECFERAKDLHLEHGQIYSNLSQAYLDDGRPEMVVELFEEMQHLGVLEAEIVQSTVNAFMNCGDKVSAMETALSAAKYCQQKDKIESLLSDVRSKRAKVAFFCGPDGPTFLNDILDHVKQRFQMHFFNGSTYNEMYDLMKWSDISWFEWCSEMTVEASKMEKVCKNIVRLHRYEAYLDYPKNVNWANIDTLITIGNESVNKALYQKVPDISSMTRILSIPNGVNMDKVRFVERKRGKNLAFIGNMKMVKNPMFALQCMQKLHEIDRDYKLFFAGSFPAEDGFVEQYLRHMVATLGLEDVVIFDGWQEDINSWLADKHYIILTSVIESQGMGVLEGMASGLKPVVHNFPGAEQIFASKYLFSTADDLCRHILSTDYDPYEYRSFVEDKYSLKLQLMRINAVITGFEMGLDPAVDDVQGKINCEYNTYNTQSRQELLK